jgi:hypothetical protein
MATRRIAFSHPCRWTKIRRRAGWQAWAVRLTPAFVTIEGRSSTLATQPSLSRCAAKREMMAGVKDHGRGISHWALEATDWMCRPVGDLQHR